MKIVAIGGGEIGRPGTKIETLGIDKRLLALTGKKHPKLLFIPTASDDSAGYRETVEKYFGSKLGCDVQHLLLWKQAPKLSEIGKKILAADLIYVGGGNTLKMLKLWRKKGVDRMLIDAIKRGTVVSGLSAGAICWFQYGHSDSRKFNDPSAHFIRLRGLNVVPLFVAPHYDFEKGRPASVKMMLKGTRQVAIGLDNCSALFIDNDRYEIVTSRRGAVAHRCYWKDGKYHTEPLPNGTKGNVSELGQWPQSLV